MAGGWRLNSHPRREWLLEWRGQRLALSAELGRALAPLRGSSPSTGEIVDRLVGSHWSPAEAERIARRIIEGLQSGDRIRGRSLIFRIPLCPTGWTDGLARRLQELTSWPALGVLLGLGLVGYGTSLTWAGQRGLVQGLWPGLGLFFLTAFWHELGHAAALRRGGYSAGGIGMGILFIIPVLYADVSAVALLPRGDRLRVDISGVAFQLGLGGMLAWLATLEMFSMAGPALQLSSWLALAAVCWSLLPFVRSDGYWALGDLLGVGDLDRPMSQGRSSVLIVFLVFYRMLNGIFLLVVGVLFPRRVFGLVAGLGKEAGFPHASELAWLAALLVGLLGGWMIVRRLIWLWAVSRIDLAKLRSFKL